MSQLLCINHFTTTFKAAMAVRATCLLAVAAAGAAGASASASAAAAAPPHFTLLPASSAPPVPTPQQLKYQGALSALIHCGMGE